jgi:hypothetical protein
MNNKLCKKCHTLYKTEVEAIKCEKSDIKYYCFGCFAEYNTKDEKISCELYHFKMHDFMVGEMNK